MKVPHGGDLTRMLGYRHALYAQSSCNPWLSSSLQLRHFQGEYKDGDMCKQASRRNSAA